MQANALFFWIFAPILVVSAFAVITAKNPVHSVLFLILSFVCAAGLFLLLGAEFLAMILIIVYVGAVAVLFLFIVMLLDVDFARLRQGFVEYLPQGLLIAVVVAIELIYVVSGLGPSSRAASPASPAGTLSNTAALGEVLYTRYFYFFQAAGTSARRSRAPRKPQSRCARCPRAPAYEGSWAWASISPTISLSPRSCSRSASPASFSTTRTSSSS
jgi:NADH-quinone oxidoreductase subunit J